MTRCSQRRRPQDPAASVDNRMLFQDPGRLRALRRPIHFQMKIDMKIHLRFGLLCMLASGAQAGEVYTSVGLPGLTIGYSAPVAGNVSLRADLTTVGSPTQHRSIGTAEYDVKVKADRLGLFADWFVSDGFRATGGLTFNNARADLDGRANGGAISIGGTTYAAGPEDRFEGKVKYPTTMPYLGIGYGHAAGTQGWGFVFDLGLAFGRAKVTGSATGPLLSQSVSQQDTQREVEKVRAKLAKLPGIPQLSIGAAYSF